METLYLVEAYGGVYYESDWHENIGVYSTLEKAIEAGNIYMRSIIEETKRDPRFANQEMTYEEITLANWKKYHRYKYDSEFDYSEVEIIQRQLDSEPINGTFC